MLPNNLHLMLIVPMGVGALYVFGFLPTCCMLTRPLTETCLSGDKGPQSPVFVCKHTSDSYSLREGPLLNSELTLSYNPGIHPVSPPLYAPSPSIKIMDRPLFLILCPGLNSDPYALLAEHDPQSCISDSLLINPLPGQASSEPSSWTQTTRETL